MASEEHVDVSMRLPADLGEWLDERATDTDRSREDVLRELVAAYRSVSEDGQGDGVADEATAGYASQDALDDLAARAVDADALDAHREEVRDELDDVKKRVVQVKREADAKAAADHEHAELGERLDSVEDDLTSLSASLADLEDDVDAGFSNFEDVLEYLTETTDDLEAKTRTLARVVVDVRKEVKRLGARESRRAEAEALKLAANREGVRAADCEECGSQVDVALLSAPECPHCASTFGDVEKRSGLFSSNRLVTGDPPALPEGDADDLGPDDLADELADHAEDVDG